MNSNEISSHNDDTPVKSNGTHQHPPDNHHSDDIQSAAKVYPMQLTDPSALVSQSIPNLDAAADEV